MSFGNCFEQTVRSICEQSDPFARVNRAIADHGFGGTVGLDTGSGRIVWSGIVLPDGSPEDPTPLPSPLAAAEEFVLKALHEYEADEREAEAGGEDLDAGEAFEDAVEDAAEDLGVDVDEDAFAPDPNEPEGLPVEGVPKFATYTDLAGVDDGGFGADEFYETDPLSATSDDYGADEPPDYSILDDPARMPQDEPFDPGMDQYALDPFAGQDAPLGGGIDLDMGPIPDYTPDLEATGLDLDLPGDSANHVLNPNDPMGQVDMGYGDLDQPLPELPDSAYPEDAVDLDHGDALLDLDDEDNEWLDADLTNGLDDYRPRFESARPLREFATGGLTPDQERRLTAQKQAEDSPEFAKGDRVVIVNNMAKHGSEGVVLKQVSEFEYLVALPYGAQGRFHASELLAESARPLREDLTHGLADYGPRFEGVGIGGPFSGSTGPSKREVLLKGFAQKLLKANPYLSSDVHSTGWVIAIRRALLDYYDSIGSGNAGQFVKSLSDEELRIIASNLGRPASNMELESRRPLREAVRCKGDPSLLTESERRELGRRKVTETKMPTITQKEVDRLNATGHVAYVYKRKGIVSVDGFKIYKLVK